MPETKELNVLLNKEITYDGEEYTRENVDQMVTEYKTRQETDLKDLEKLRTTHDDIAREMNKDLAESTTAWEHVKSMVKSDSRQSFASNFQGLLEKIPIIKNLMPDRSITELLQEKIAVAERRTKEMGNFLDRVESRIEALRNDITRLNKKMVVAAHNEEKAAKYILDLKDYKTRMEEELAGISDQKSTEYREKSAMMDEVNKKIWGHGGKLRIYSHAEDRIAGIIRMNNNFLEILTNLHTNMTILFEAGNEVLDDLRGNLSGLATVSQASDITLKMQESMQSLKDSVNKVASLASNTSLYLTQNVERMTNEMKIYDDSTVELIEANLNEEREVKEKWVDDTIEMARKEYGLMQEARDSGSAMPQPPAEEK